MNTKIEKLEKRQKILAQKIAQLLIEVGPKKRGNDEQEKR